ncbi:MAG: hypothetical protein WCH82_05455 [Mycobacteriaceae bacterium]
MRNITMNIYLDVDGVLVQHDGTLARHADEFLAELVASGHPLHWLTTRCRDGDPAPVREALSKLVAPATADLLHAIRPTSWATSKLEAIDLKNPFIWFDDQPLQFEIEELRECGLLERWVKVDLVNEPGQLGTLRLLDLPGHG